MGLARSGGELPLERDEFLEASRQIADDPRGDPRILLPLGTREPRQPLRDEAAQAPREREPVGLRSRVGAVDR